jgi:site-specific DNA-cytosine methylase
VTYNDLSLFSGITGLELGPHQAEECQTVAYIEWDPYCQAVLACRSCEGHISAAPIYGDITKFDAGKYRGLVDRVFAGFPCQDISTAGKGAGIKEGTRSGLFFKVLQTACVVGSPIIFMENVSAILRRGVDTVLGSLASEGYDAEWCTIPASYVGAPHKIRDRWFCLAYSESRGTHDDECRWKPDIDGSDIGGELADMLGSGCVGEEVSVSSWRQDQTNAYAAGSGSRHGLADLDDGGFTQLRRTIPGETTHDSTQPGNITRNARKEVKPGLGRRTYGLPCWLDELEYPARQFLPQKSWEPDRAKKSDDPAVNKRIHALGNAVIPQQAAAAWGILTQFNMKNTNDTGGVVVPIHPQE